MSAIPGDPTDVSPRLEESFPACSRVGIELDSVLAELSPARSCETQRH
ncbi:Hypothetical protein CAP_4275 [Chondromyces apiculatus DSM 436]|uniref:Uncharacterized protein n=1 Tax=Chondromyces apiculatus DSM 436 TaxID=1192034 RepID=A0A017T5X4_9BACT|nr:Hypothetical protein CAP_4275 [Chondromyces apiculatus DSM 436]